MTSNDPFADPAESTGIDYTQIQGSLLMIQVLSHEDHIPTVHTQAGEKNPAIRGTVTILDGQQRGHVYEDALIFPRVLIGQLRSRVGQVVLGRLGQGEKKAGKNAPWKLLPANEQDKQVARSVLSPNGAPAPHSSGNPAQGSLSDAEPPF